MMGRRKVKLELIANESMRKTTFRKRKTGLLKKANELTTLCGVEGCVIIYGHNDPHPHVWPSTEQAEHTLARFKSLPEHKQTKHMINHKERRPGDNTTALQVEAEVSEKRQNRDDIELDMLLEEMLDDKVIDKMSLEDMKELYGYLEKWDGSNRDNGDIAGCSRRADQVEIEDDEEEAESESMSS